LQNVTETLMTYPPQSGGGWQDQPGNWQGQPGGGWQDPAGGGYVDPARPTYLDPASGQPAYLDPISGQPQPPGYPAQQQYNPGPGYADYGQYPGYPAAVMAPSRRTNGLSIASMVVAIVALISSPCYGIPGVAIGLVGAILGHVGLKQSKERNEDGGGMAIAGIAIGWIAVLAGLIALAIYLYVWFWFKNTVDNYPTYPTPRYT
jgi:hypothetical protein